MSDDPQLRFRQEPWTALPRSAADSYRTRRRRRAAAGRKANTNPLEPVLAQVADAEVWLDVYEELRQYGGPAPGVDGLTYAKLGRSEAASILRAVAAAVRHGSYRPQPARLVRIPKPSGGQRTLATRSLCDRVVAAALHRVLTPLWESVFLDGSWGFRPHRNTWGLLATLKKVVEQAKDYRTKPLDAS